MRLKKIHSNKKKVQYQTLPLTLDEANDSLQIAKEKFYDLSKQVSYAGQNQDMEQILYLIDEVKKAEEQIQVHELYIKKIEESPYEHNLLW